MDDATFFELKIRPVLASKCLKCHGPAKASGGLDSTLELAFSKEEIVGRQPCQKM